MAQILKGFIDSFLQLSEQQGPEPPAKDTPVPEMKWRITSHGGLSTKTGKSKILKNTKKSLNLICGKKILVPQTLKMTETSVVGRTKGRYPSRDFLESWSKSNLWGLLNYLPKTLVLSCDWFIFKLKCKEDMGKIPEKPWSFKSTPMPSRLGR